MSRTTELLDRWKKHRGITSDNKAAETLHLTRSAISQWRNERAHADIEIVIKMAAELHDDAVREVALIEGAKAKSVHAKRFWAQLIRFSGTAAAITLAVLSLTSKTYDSDFNSIISKNQNLTDYIYASIKLRKMWSRIDQFFQKIQEKLYRKRRSRSGGLRLSLPHRPRERRSAGGRLSLVRCSA